MGRLIPAGTGLPAYKRLQVVVDEKCETFAPPTYARGADRHCRGCRRRLRRFDELARGLNAGSALLRASVAAVG